MSCACPLSAIVKTCALLVQAARTIEYSSMRACLLSDLCSTGSLKPLLCSCDAPGSGTLSAAKAAAIFVPVAAVVAGGVAAVVISLLVLNHRRQARNHDHDLIIGACCSCPNTLHKRFVVEGVMLALACESAAGASVCGEARAHQSRQDGGNHATTAC